VRNLQFLKAAARWPGDIPLPSRYPGIKDLETSLAKPLKKKDFRAKAII
jgi:hypothetical protein